jgi:hypothetical protein
LNPPEAHRAREYGYIPHPVAIDGRQGPREEEKNIFETNPEELADYSRGQMMGQQFLGNIGGEEYPTP